MINQEGVKELTVIGERRLKFNNNGSIFSTTLSSSETLTGLITKLLAQEVRIRTEPKAKP